MKVIGLTGDAGSGKTTVAGILRELGAAIIDSDVVAREVVAPGTPTLAALVSAFGPDYLTAAGTLDRKRLADRVFTDPEAHRLLDDIIMQPIIDRIRALVSEKVAQGFGVVVIDAPRLLDVGMGAEVDQVWVVTADWPVKVQRLVDRGLQREEAERILAHQMPQAEKVRQADAVIDNNAPLTATREQVIKYWTALQTE